MITNNHVVTDAAEIVVQQPMLGTSFFKARVVMTWKQFDLAMVVIDEIDGILDDCQSFKA